MAIVHPSWWQRYGQPPALKAGPYFFMDTAFKTGKHNDYSVVAVWGIGTDGHFYVLHLWRGQATFPNLRRKTAAMAERWRPEAIYIEDAASGQSLLQAFYEEGLPVVAYRPERDKVSRLHSVSPFIEAKRVFLPESGTEGAEWVEGFVYEHTAFPFGEHDDQVDTTAMALLVLAQRRGFEEFTPEVLEAYEDLGL